MRAIFKVHTEFDAGLCTRGPTDTVRVSALKADWEKTPLPHREGMEPGSVSRLAFQCPARPTAVVKCCLMSSDVS